jgi:hypothetical protein
MVETAAALRAQRQRAIDFRRRLRRLGDQNYDTDAALVRTFSAFFPRFTGHTTVQLSLEYAMLLLQSDDRLYGGDDAIEANRIIQQVLKYQDLREGSESFGNFYWMTHWTHPKDRNAVSFLASGLVYVYLTFPHKLWDETRAALERAFPDVLVGIRNHKVRWQYSNIYFLNIAGLVGLSRVLDDLSAHDEAVRDFDMWLGETAKDGIHEFNSPNYTPVTLWGMEAAWAHTPDAAFRDRLERTMDVVTYQLALNLFPNGFLGGTPSRAYRDDALYGTGWTSVYAPLKFGPPLTFPPENPSITLAFTNMTLYDYVPPAPIRELASHKPEYLEIHDRVISTGGRRTHVMTPASSFASQTDGRVGGISPPFYVLLVRHAPGLRRSVPFLPDESHSRQPAAGFLSRQEGNRLVGRLDYEPTEEERARLLEDHTYVCEPRVLFGLREHIYDVRIGNVDWAGGDVSLLPGQAVAISYGDLFLGVSALALDRAGNPVPGRTTLAYGENGELRLHLRILGGREYHPTDESVEVLLFAHVTESTRSLADYADWLIGWRLERRGVGADVAFAAVHPAEATSAYPASPDEPDPLGDALHVSPYLVLHSGDLVRLVNGDEVFEFAREGESSP